jgi:molecular chaperone DnaK
VSDSPGTPAAPGKPGSGKRPSIGLQVRLPCSSLDEVKARYAGELKENRFFIRTKATRPKDTLVRLDLQLASGDTVFRGAGVVIESGAAGMRLQLLGVDEAGHAFIAGLGGTPPRLLKRPAAPAPKTQPKPEPKAQPTPEPEAAPMIGIDLGTSNSAAAVVRHGKPFVIPSREGYNTIPSIVAVSDKGKMIVGHPAKGQLLINPTNTVYGAKRLIGRQFESPVVRDLRGRFPYQIVQGERGEAAVQLGAKQMSLQQISALVLTEVKQIAEQWLKAKVSRAVITVPAYYNDNQRQAVREAGELAGLQVARILSEPTAAALAFAHGRRLDRRVFVYDLGGGTFDASVLELHGSVYEVVSTGGDTFLGGVDFDKVVVDHLLSRFKERHKMAFPGDRVALQRITDAAERAKIALSERQEMEVKVPFVAAVEGKPYDLATPLLRTELVALTGHLVDRTLAVCEQVLSARGLKPSDIDDILLVGGQSRMPLVRERVRQFFGKDPSRAVHPDEAVAMGAAVMAHSIESADIDGLVLVDVLPISIGVGLPGGRFRKILERNSPLPHRKAMTLATTRDDQDSLEIIVFQGESDRAQDNEYLGTLHVPDLPPGPRGSHEFEIVFELSPEALLSITARNQKTGHTLTSIFSTKDTPEEVKQRLADSSAPAAAAEPEKKGWLRRLFGRKEQRT